MVNSVESVNRGFSERLRLNRAILKNAYLTLPVVDEHLEIVQVGRSRVSCPDFCGKHTSFYMCRDVEHHRGVVLDGVDFTGKAVLGHGHLWCKNAGCPICFLNGWRERAARAIVGRLDVGVERGFGEVEHFTVSPPRTALGLPIGDLRRMSEDACLKRGWLGFCLIFHARRIDRGHGSLKWSPHFHGLGFVRGGYADCRACGTPTLVRCEGCGGFEARTRALYLEDGFIVKVHDRRRTVSGTVRYILSHASYRVGIRRFHIVAWCGVLGCSKLKGRKVWAERLCSVCDSVGVRNVMVRVIHRGKEFVATNIGDPLYRSVLAVDEFDSEGSPLFVDYGRGAVG
jgi:hypothetical protein